MYQMLKLKLGPQDIRGTEKRWREENSVKKTDVDQQKQQTLDKPHQLTYFDKSAGKHLLINLVF